MSLVQRAQGMAGARAGRLAAIRFGAPALGLATDTTIRHLLGIDGLGRYAVFTSMAGLFAIVVSLGMQGPVNRELATAEGDDTRSRLAASAVAATGLAAVSLTVALVIGRGVLLAWWNTDGLDHAPWYVGALAASLAVQGLVVAIARGYDRLTIATLTELVTPKLFLLAGLGLVAVGVLSDDLSTVLILTVLAGIGPVVLAWAWLARRDRLRPVRPDRTTTTDLALRSWALLGHQIVFTVAASAALWILDQSVDSAASGLFYLVTRLAAFVAILAVVVQFLYATPMATAYRDDTLDELQPTLRAVVAKALAGAVVVALGLLVVHRPMLALLAGNSPSAEATWAFVILAVGQLVQVGTGPAGYALIMADRQKAILASTTVGALLVVVLALTLTGPFGIVGAAVATAVGQAAVNLLNMMLVRRLVGLKTGARAIRRTGSGYP